MPPKKAKAKGGGKAKRVTFDKDDDGHEDARGAFMASEFTCLHRLLQGTDRPPRRCLSRKTAGLRQQSLADAMKAEAEAAALEAAEADAKRELRRLEQQVNRGDPLNPSQLTKLEQLTQQLEGSTDAGEDPDERLDPVEEMPDTVAGMLRKLVEVQTAADLFFLLALFLAVTGALVLLTLPLGSWGFVYGLPHRVAHFLAVGGVSGELFALITVFLAWRAEKWQPIPALDWQTFGYAPCPSLKTSFRVTPASSSIHSTPPRRSAATLAGPRRASASATASKYSLESSPCWPMWH